MDAAQAQRRRLRWIALDSLITAIVTFIAGVVIGNGMVLLVAFVAFTACIVFFIYSFVYSSKIVKHRNRYDLLKKLLAIIQNDAQLRAAFSVSLSLKGTPKLLSEAPWPVRAKGKQQFFEESWLSVEGPLMDGTTVREELTELSRKRTYRNPRGKYKTKIRSRYLVTVRFAYPKDLYGDARPAQLALNQPVRVPPSATLRDLRVSEKAIAIKAMVNAENDVAMTAGMLSLGAYRILNFARRGNPR